MKHLRILTLSLFAAVIIPAWGGNAQEPDEKYPEITFEKTTHDFGLFDRAHGDKTCWFVFTNTGDKELLILSASSTCGCTVPEFPKTAILPGMKDSIKVSYNGSTRRVGKLKKTIALTTNCKVNSAYLYIAGEMVEELVADRVKPDDNK
ncbi:MAG: DUF1573 domain-containing protein [Bacteroidaceae bacterium]|nr:DUF1573 domain-containing protein [Bacteroidaceae bacterium]